MKNLLNSHLFLAIALASTSLGPGQTPMDEVNPPTKKPKSWQAGVFAGSALLAVVAGIVVICVSNGSDHNHRASTCPGCPDSCQFDCEGQRRPHHEENHCTNNSHHHSKHKH